MKSKYRTFFSILFLVSVSIGSSQPILLTCGHAHNDYTYTRPLLDALQYGFKSVEIDVFLTEGKLKVAHNRRDLDVAMDLETLYLKPVREIIRLNHGWVYAGDTSPLIFMIDFKTDADSTYFELMEKLEPYKDLLTMYQDDKLIHTGPIQILISGNKPWKQLHPDEERWVTLDGGIEQRNDRMSDKIMDRVSSTYSAYFSWKGQGPMPNRQKSKLNRLVKEAHSHGRQIRFYGMPQKESVWETLLNAGVDWMNVDELEKFAKFYNVYQLSYRSGPEKKTLR